MKKIVIVFIGFMLMFGVIQSQAQSPTPGTIPAMTAASSIASQDLLIVHKYPFTDSSTQKITWAAILANMGAGVLSSITVADVTNDNRIRITNNTSRTPGTSVNELYPEGNVWKVNENGSERIMAKFIDTPPTSPTSSGTTGELAMDSTYFYFCYGTNTWGRITKGAW
jgi:hypothetical protein